MAKAGRCCWPKLASGLSMSGSEDLPELGTVVLGTQLVLRQRLVHFRLKSLWEVGSSRRPSSAIHEGLSQPVLPKTIVLPLSLEKCNSVNHTKALHKPRGELGMLWGAR